MIFFDTESIGFYGPTVLIQYCVDDGDPVIHNIWDHTVGETLDLIESHVTHPSGVVGFNLTHDWYHYSRTYGVLAELPRRYRPDPLDYLDVEKEDIAHDKYCLKPVKACDLMLVGRKTKFQASLNQKQVTMRKVPKVLAPLLVEELKKNVPIPSIYFARSKKGYAWRIVPLIKGTAKEATSPEDEIDPDFVNIQLKFAPSTSLKAIMAYIGHDVVTLDDLDPLPKPEEYAWFPHYGGWSSVFNEHLWAWRNDPRRLEYAKNDPLYTRELYHYLGDPVLGDVDSELACAIGAMHWRGFAVDIPACKERLKVAEQIFSRAPVNINSPRQVKNWLHEVCTPLEKQAVDTTGMELLKKISDEWKEDNPELARRCGLIIEARRAEEEMTLLRRLIQAGRLYVTFKVIGTKSNRMSGGSESYIKSKGSINPQGIKKGGAIRSLFPLAHPDLILCGGDFSGYEVSIAEAVYKDPRLREDLLKGLKMHGLFGAEMYGLTYEEIMATEDNNINDVNGYYQRAKRGFFASLYGAMEDKIGKAMWLPKEAAKEGLDRFANKYSRIREYRENLQKKFTAISQKELGKEITWSEPAEYEESFLGFRRYFTLEFNIIRCLYNMARNPSEEFLELGKNLRVVRRDRVQTASGAALSALYAVAFGIQGQVFRAAANHDIQSPGAQMTKELQGEIWTVQPVGINKWYVMPMNIHDEIQAPCAPEVVDIVATKVANKVESFREKVPLIKMKWKTHLTTWGH